MLSISYHSSGGCFVVQAASVAMSFGAVRRTPADAASGGVGTAIRWRGRSLRGDDGAVKT